jgi:hypothetical protein
MAARYWRVAVVAGLMLGGARPVFAQFTIEELELHLPARPGTPVTRLIPVRSDIDSTQQVRVTLRDWMRDSTGSNVLLDYNTVERSCGGRLEAFPLTFQLPPRATEFIRVTYTPSAPADRGCWGMVVSETVRPPQPTMTAGSVVTITTLMGVKIYAHAVDERIEGTIVSADVEEFYEQRTPPATDSVLARQFAARFENSGTAHLRVKTTVEVRDESGRIVSLLSGSDAYITPGAFRDILVRVPELPSGRYVAVMLFDFGGQEITAAQVELVLP